MCKKNSVNRCFSVHIQSISYKVSLHAMDVIPYEITVNIVEFEV